MAKTPSDAEETKTVKGNFTPRGSTSRDRAFLTVISGPNVGRMYRIDIEKRYVLGRSSKADIRLDGEGVSRQHCRVQLEKDKLQIIDLQSRNGVYFQGNRVDQLEINEGEKIALGSDTVLRFAYHDELDEEFQQKMLESALQDPLTSAFNKRYFQEQFSKEFGFAIRHKSILSVLILDVDNFKQVNDTYGHLAGDHTLRTLVDHIRSSVRNEDVLARYGGDEFVIIVRSTPAEGLRILAERLREEIHNLEIYHDDKRIAITTSIGVATLSKKEFEAPSDMLEAADQALYEAKENGRDQVAYFNAERTTRETLS
ncbi:MAG: diguanylate cyclase [Myxococcales bacterium]|nr:MAG: diguanylate cyclase [Myxococcales bacterium]